MGLAASQARFLSLTARKSNVEYQGQQVNQSRTSLAEQSASLFNDMVNLKPPTPPDANLYPGGFESDAYKEAFAQYEIDKANYEYQYARINARTEALQEEDRQLELKLKQIDTEQEAIQTEMEAVKKVIDKNIEATFKTFA